MFFPQYVVSKWIGHSITVSGRHYANTVPEELFDQAAREAVQNPVQHAAESERTGVKSRKSNSPQNAQNPEDFGVLQEHALACNAEESGAGGIRTPVPMQSA